MSQDNILSLILLANENKFVIMQNKITLLEVDKDIF